MLVPVSWLRTLVDLPSEVSVDDLTARLTMLGIKLESLDPVGGDIKGPLLVGQVLDFESETHSNGKTIRWCQVDVGEGEPRGIVCGASNFEVGDLVVVSLPGSVLPGGFEISRRKTYGYYSDGMICSTRELGTGDDHSGILVLPDDFAPVGSDATGPLGLRDTVIEFEINPDRAYALSLRGVARETALAYGVEFKDPIEQVELVTPGDGYPVRVEDPQADDGPFDGRTGCGAFAAVTVAGVDPSAPSPPWLSRRVQLAGVRPISLAVDVTNYVMLELGQPLHAYDADKLRGSIVVRRASVGEKLITLDGVTRDLDPEDLLITDDSGPIGLAGVMGGETTEIGASTTKVVLEAANFDPVSIARTARRHKLPSEASRRFERGVDPTIGFAAAVHAAWLLVEYGGGEVRPVATVLGGQADGRKIRAALDLPARISGVDIAAETVLANLRAVGCAVEADDRDVTAIPPPWRPDLNDPYDLVEEVVRVVGYDKVPSVLPVARVGTGLTRKQQLCRRVGRALADAGFVETLTFSFMGDRDAAGLQLAVDDFRRNAIRVANPLSEEDPLLRTTLLPGVLRALGRNVARGQTDLGLYEIGAVYLHSEGERPVAPNFPVDRRPTIDQLKELDAALPAQPVHLAVALCGERSASGWWGPGRSATWADAIEACRVVGRAVGAELSVVPGTAAPWHPGRCAQIVVGDELIGYAGELHPRTCAAYGLPPRACAAEIDLDALLAHATTVLSAPRLSSFPVGKEDVALVVDEDVSAAAVAEALTDGAGELLESVRIFDVYTGEQVGDGKKSLAFSLRFRAPDRTLTEAEIGAARDGAVAEAAARLGAVQRA
jgi:phenylalanyl-tRNA synthetase beta chain